MADDRFTFFRSYYDALKTMKPAERDQAVMALLGYIFDGVEPRDLRPAPALFLMMAKPVISSRKRGGQPGNTNNPNGRRGNAESEPNRTESEPNNEPNRTESETECISTEPNRTEKNRTSRIMDHGSWNMNHESEKMDHGSGEGESESGDAGSEPENTPAPSRPPDKKINFSRIPPDPAELDEYARRKNIPHAVAAKFYAHYYGNGWTVNGAPMANWGAKLTEWAMGGIK